MKQNTPPLVLRSEMRTDSVPVDEHYSTEGYFYQKQSQKLNKLAPIMEGLENLSAQYSHPPEQ